jgi:hypothetical protein
MLIIIRIIMRKTLRKIKIKTSKTLLLHNRNEWFKLHNDPILNSPQYNLSINIKEEENYIFE